MTVAILGIDLAKHVFQLHGLDAHGRAVVSKRVSRAKLLERQRVGIAKAKMEGKYRGRQPTARAKAKEVLALKREGTGAAAIAKRVGISRASVYRVLATAGAAWG